MSIRLVHALKIFNGTKSLEFRTRVWNPKKTRVSRVYVYVPELKGVIGFFIPGKILLVNQRLLKSMDPEVRNTVENYLGTRRGFGIQIKTRFPLLCPKSLDLMGVSRAPQSWQYLPGGS